MTPEQRVKNYLTQNQPRLQQSSSLDAVISDVKLSLFYGFSGGLSAEQLRKLVVEWATFNAPGLLITVAPGTPWAPDPAAHVPTQTELDDLVASVNKVVSKVNAGANLFGDKDNNLKLKVTGLTANLKGADGFLTVGVGWGGSAVLKANKGLLFLEGEISSDSWSLSFSFPRDSFTPNLIVIPDVFDQGMSSSGNIARAVAKLPNISGVRNITSQLKPDLAKVGDAFGAVGAINDTKPGVNFGFKIQNPTAAPGQQGMPGGVQGVFTITWVI
jgi:hypothetical protein